MFLNFPPHLFTCISYALVVFLSQSPSHLPFLTEFFVLSLSLYILVCFRLTIFHLLILVNSGAFCVKSSMTLQKCEISWNCIYLGRKVRGDFILVWIIKFCVLKYRTWNTWRIGNDTVNSNGSRNGLGFHMCTHTF